MAPNLRRTVHSIKDEQSSPGSISNLGARLRRKEAEASRIVVLASHTGYWEWPADTQAKSFTVTGKQDDLLSSERLVANLLKDATRVFSSGAVAEHDDYWKEDSSSPSTVAIAILQSSESSCRDQEGIFRVDDSSVQCGSGDCHLQTTSVHGYARYWDEMPHKITPSDRYWNMAP